MVELNKKKLAGAGVLLLAIVFYLFDLTREIFLRDVIGPVVADAKNVSSTEFMGFTVQPGYNVYNEIFFGAIIIFLLFMVYRTVKKQGADEKLILAMSTFLFAGGFLRALGDTGMVEYPFNVLLISPLTYISLTFIGLITLVVAFRLEKDRDIKGYRIVYGVGSIITLFLASLITRFAYFNGLSREGLMVIPISAGVLILVALFQYLLSRRKTGSMLDSKTGYLLSMGHALDGISSSYGISVLGYTEKKPLSQMVMELFGNPYGFLVLKVLLVFLLLNYVKKEELDSFTYLVLLAIAAAGLGPGIRNVLRIILGI